MDNVVDVPVELPAIVFECHTLRLRAVHDVLFVRVPSYGHIAVQEIGIVVVGIRIMHQVVVNVGVDVAIAVVFSIRDSVAPR